MKRAFITSIIVTALMLPFGLSAQNSFPAPGSGSGGNGGFGGNSMPAPGTGSRPAYQTPPPPPPSNWGNPWNTPGWNSWNGPIIVNTPMSSPNWQNSGQMNVIGVGYDIQGVWRTVPMRVSYQYNGVQYNVTVINTWDPWTDSWNNGVYDQAFNTSYYLRGTTYNYYVVTSTGTYYFNL